MNGKRARAIWFLTAFITALYAWAYARGLPASHRLAPGFAPVPLSGGGPEMPVLTEEFICRDTGSIAHVASLGELSDGRLVAAWYSGSREGAADVAVLLAVHGGGPAAAWGRPRVVVNPTVAAAELRRHVGKVGNAVVFTDGTDRLFLVYVTVPFGGWAFSSLNLKRSTDAGATWTASQRLTLSPLFNFSTLVKNKPLPLASGGYLLPVSHEHLGKFAELLWLPGGSEAGVGLRTTRLCGGRSFHQPTLVAIDAYRGLALLRSARSGGAVGLTTTSDGGATWDTPRATMLPNPDAGIDAVVLSGGRVLLAFNDHPFGRSNLKLAISSDAGTTWTRLATLEEEPGAEFSYPFLLRARGGLIHLVYTWKRHGFKHVTFNEAWVEARMREAR